MIEKTKYGANILQEPKIFRLKERYFGIMDKNCLVIALSEETEFYNVMPLELEKTIIEEEFFTDLIRSYPNGNFPIDKEQLTTAMEKKSSLRGNLKCYTTNLKD